MTTTNVESVLNAARGFSFLLLFAVFILCSICVLSMLITKKNGENTQDLFDESEKYRYTQLSISSGESSSSIVSLNHPVGEEGYRFSKRGDTLSLISQFGTTEYKCTGICYCSSRRSSSTIVKNGVTYLLAAVSSLIAVEKAKEYFKERCTEKCRSNSHFTLRSEEEEVIDIEPEVIDIEHDVEDCEPLQGEELKEYEGKFEKVEEAEEHPFGEFVERNIPSYECFGRCVIGDPKYEISPRQVEDVMNLAELRRRYKKGVKKYEKKKGKCLRLTLTETIFVRPDDMDEVFMDDGNIIEDKNVDMQRQAEINFVFQRLNRFCQDSSMFVFTKDGNENPVDWNMCNGFHSKAIPDSFREIEDPTMDDLNQINANPKDLNKSVKCKKVEASAS